MSTQTTSPMTVGAPILTFGETLGLLVARDTGSLAYVDQLDLRIAGAESNVAIGLARLGTPSRWVGRIGDDALGLRIVRTLRAEDVDVRAVVDPAAPTAVMLKERPRPGHSNVVYYRGSSAGSRLALADVLPALEGVGLVHLTGITPALSSSARATVFGVIEGAAAAGVPISFDVNHRSRLWGPAEASHLYRAIAAKASIVFAGEDEAAMLAPEATGIPDLLQAVADLGPRHVLIKRGSLGAAALISGEYHTVPAVRVDVVDTVGAGDGFVAGYLSGLAAGAEPVDALRIATTVGARACESSGDWDGYPTQRELASGGDPVTR